MAMSPCDVLEVSPAWRAAWKSQGHRAEGSLIAAESEL